MNWSSILVELVEKSSPLNLVKLMLKFDNVWIPYSSSLDFGVTPRVELKIL